MDVYLTKNPRRNNGQQRIFTVAKEAGQNPETDGPTPGGIHQGGAQLRTGLAIHSCPRGETDVVPGFQQEGRRQSEQAVLGYKKMSSQEEESVSGLGI